MTIQGKFEADQNGQVILGEGGSQAPNVYVVIHVATGTIEVSGQYLHAEHRPGISPDNGPYPLSEIKLHKGQSAVIYGFYVRVVGKKSEGGSPIEYGAGTFEVTSSI